MATILEMPSAGSRLRSVATVNARTKTGVTIVLIVALLVLWYFVPLRQWLDASRGWFADRGAFGPILYAAAYALGTVMLVPGSVLTLGAGYLFGVGVGFVVVLGGASTGAVFAFLIGRYVARATVERAIKSRPKFAAIDRAIEQDGWKIVGLLRLSPLVPFTLQNYFYGVTSVRFVPYVVASVVGMAPGALAYVYLGAAGGQASQGGSWSAAQWVLFIAGLAATFAVVILVGRRARAQLESQGVTDDVSGDAQ